MKHMKLFMILPLILPLLFGIGAALILRGPSLLAASSLDIPQQNVFDTRACASNPASANCNGQFPVTTRGLPGLGSGACIDGKTKKFPNVFPDGAHSTDEIDLYWSPTCQSYFAYGATNQRNAKLTIQIIHHSGITLPSVQGEQTELFNSEITNGPILQTEIWSPIMYGPSSQISAKMIVQDAHGNGYYAVETLHFVAGVQQTLF